jgi:hypothetical protein
MRNTFSQIDSIAPPRWKRNAFDLSHYKRMSANQGELIPTLVLECVPGDTIKLNQEILTRFSPLFAPIYEDIDMITHFYKVPYYMLMRRSGENDSCGWEDFLTGDPENLYGTDSVPYLEITDARKAVFYEGTLADYLGYPVTDSGVTIHANAQIYVNLFRVFAYWLIRDEYYRDQNLQDTIDVKAGASDRSYPYWGGDHGLIYDHLFPSRPMPVCWEKDYFTSALPYAHDPNNTSVEYDLDIVGSGDTFFLSDGGAGSGLPAAGDLTSNGSDYYIRESGPGNPLGFRAGYDPGLSVTLEIMELRRTEALFRWYEAQNRGGHRYEEHMLSVYGVKVKRPRNTPIYLGGNRQKVQISEVTSQTETLDNAAAGSESVTTPLGGFGGRSVSYGKTKDIITYCDEHCIIMGLTIVRPRSTYSQGVNRHISKLDREDWFIPHLQGIGDQSILNKELYWDMPDSSTGLPDQVFGYAPRYSEYKFEPNTLHADMRSSLNFWHCGRTFTDTPSLNETFIAMNYSNDELHRIHVNTTSTDDKLWLFVHNYVRAIRPMRKYDYGQ